MSDPNQPYGAVPPAGPPPAGFPPPGFPPPGGSAGGPAGPGYPGGPTGPRGKGRGLWIALGVVGALALVGVVVALVLLLVGDDDGDRSGTDDSSGDSTNATGPAPDEVVQSLLDAAGDDDCDEAKSHLTETAQAADPCSAAEFRLLSTEDVESEIGEPRIDGDTATVPVGLTSSAGSSDYLFELEQVDGEWLVASYALDHDADPSEGTDEASTDGPTDSSTDSSTDSPSGAPSGNSTADAVPNEPKAVVEAFFDSVVNGDCATAEDLVTDAYLEEEGECDPSEVPTDLGDQITYTVGTAKVDEDAGTATVPVEVSFSGQKESSTVRLVMESGQWRINKFG